ncbi:MAG: SDR family oxidoreductase [Pseudomonadota bacterium]
MTQERIQGRFGGKSVAVTGGGSGIGRATAIAFAGEGARVAVLDVNAEGAQRTADAIGDGAAAIALNVASRADWDQAMPAIQDAIGTLDVLVNCAGIGRAGRFEDLSDEDWQAQIDVNLTGTLLGCQQALQAMAGRGGAIVNVASIYGLIGSDDTVGYNATKGGVVLMTRSVALHCAKHQLNVRVNAVAPTYVDTEMLDPVAEAMGGRTTLTDGLGAMVPLGRVAQVSDITPAILFLASHEAAMITGTVLPIDGGQTAGTFGGHAA